MKSLGIDDPDGIAAPDDHIRDEVAERAVTRI